LTSAPAQAQTAQPLLSCPSDGHLSNWHVCSKPSNGILDHTVGLNDGVYTYVLTTSYQKTGGSTINKRLGFSAPFDGYSTVWSGWANQSAGTTSSFTRRYYDSLINCRSTQGYMEANGTVCTTPYTAAC
jgi:hypothetical protein